MSFIKIDLNSILENINAGETQTVIMGRKTIYFNSNTLHDYFKDGKNCIITEIDNNNYISGIITSEDLLQKCIENPEIKISIDFDQNIINHFPIPKYSYDYENTKVKCDYCRKEIMTSDLKTESFYSGDEEYYSDKCCPICGAYDCCDLIYESINEALSRANV